MPSVQGTIGPFERIQYREAKEPNPYGDWYTEAVKVTTYGVIEDGVLSLIPVTDLTDLSIKLTKASSAHS